MEWKLKRPRYFILGVIAMVGAVIAGTLFIFVSPGGLVAPSLSGILTLVIGAALLFGGSALLANGIQGPAAAVLGVALVGAAVVIGLVASGVCTDPWCWASAVTGFVLGFGGFSLLLVGFGAGPVVGAQYRLALMIAGGLLLIFGLFAVPLLGFTIQTTSNVRWILGGAGLVLFLVPFAAHWRKTPVSS